MALVDVLALLLPLLLAGVGAAVVTILGCRADWFGVRDTPFGADSWMGRSTGDVDGRLNAYFVFLLVFLVLLLPLTIAFDLLLAPA